ncbi:MAG: prolyl oligopeptidase family serine peptidase [Cyanobacteria bacterium SZAS LIN-3]|nr:prolyl oligopeptidase family serine peptidase [Cyanobacteria bacterium SZAS LIN-3]MBS2006372.1 prolyl oligopeptidase family serine peptidase [Cyanobacteria bacterium SZAS TMP-1]
MKSVSQIIIAAALAITTVTAVVFLILFIVSAGQNGSLKKKAAQLQAELSQTRNSQVFDGQARPGVPERQGFMSLLDGSKDEMAILPPNSFQGQKDLTLVVYLHGMGSTYMEPFLVPKDKTVGQAISEHNGAVVIASPNYRGQSAWCNEQAVADIDQNIRSLLQRFPISKIVIMGTSMGGCSALAYSYLAGDDIKRLLIGVVAAEPSGDLSLLYGKTHSQIVKNGMIGAFGGPPEAQPQKYTSRSLLNNTDKVPANLRFAIISAKQDNVIPPDFQRAIVNTLKDKKFSCELIEVDEQHGVPAASAFVQGLDYVVLGNSLR